jgi:Fe2+ transport system protein B
MMNRKETVVHTYNITQGVGQKNRELEANLGYIQYISVYTDIFYLIYIIICISNIFILLYIFETKSYCVALAGLEYSLSLSLSLSLSHTHTHTHTHTLNKQIS